MKIKHWWGKKFHGEQGRFLLYTMSASSTLNALVLFVNLINFRLELFKKKKENYTKTDER